MPGPGRHGGYFDHTPHAVGHDFRRQAIPMLEPIGISVEFSHHEVAPGQQEIDLRYADALTTADNIMTFRHVVKEVRARAGRVGHLHAEALHRPPGLGHAHPPVAVRGRAQRVPRRRRRLKLSKVAAVVHRRPAARTRREITAVTNQWVNSYKRLVRGGRTRRRRTSAGATSTAPRWCGCPSTSRQGQLDPGRGPLAGLRLQPVPGLRGACSAPGLKGIEEGYELPPGRRGRRLVAVGARAPGAGLRAAAGEPRPRRST